MSTINEVINIGLTIFVLANIFWFHYCIDNLRCAINNQQNGLSHLKSWIESLRNNEDSISHQEINDIKTRYYLIVDWMDDFRNRMRLIEKKLEPQPKRKAGDSQATCPAKRGRPKKVVNE